jgi:isopenicillin N synthase-like dioxygenase
VNVGDLLSRWSNDILRSTLHRVVAPTVDSTQPNTMTRARQSVAFFCNPNADAIISALPNCVSADRPQKYPTVKTEQYIVGRLADTYN